MARRSPKPMPFSRRRQRLARNTSVAVDDPRGHVMGGVEQYGNPTEAARQTFRYLLAMGKSRWRPASVWRRPDGLAGYVLHFVNRGQYWHRVKGRDLRIKEGGICLLDTSVRFEQGNDGTEPSELWWISFHGHEVPRLAAALHADEGRTFDHVNRRRFQSLFRQLWGVTARRPVGHEARTDAILTLILAELFIAGEHASNAARMRHGARQLSERMQAAVEYMARYGHVRIGLKQIAADIGVSLHYFAFKFKREVGVPPMRYLNRLRIEQAKRLLTTTDKAIAEVGTLVGIPNAGYFARVFRRVEGRSPEVYRADNQGRQGES